MYLRQPTWTRRLFLAAVGALAAGAFVGCGHSEPEAPPKPLYPDLGVKPNTPVFMKDSIWERTELTNTEPFPVTSFGLVANLRGTGDCAAPNQVREYIIKEMLRHGYGQRRIPGYENVQPEQILQDNRFAVVTIAAFIPPGAHAGQRIDAYVQALPNNYTSSLSRGLLFRTDLKINGADYQNPFGQVNAYAKAEGGIFVNPAYAMATGNELTTNAKVSLRSGVVLGGGLVTQDRPLWLMIRTPERRLARAIESRIQEAFQDTAAAAAQNEGYVWLYVPKRFGDNWEHFAKVTQHLYLNSDAGYAANKARELVAAAQQPDAPLMDISYCLEGLGPVALPFMTPLLSDSSRPDVQFAAARAGAFMTDPGTGHSEVLSGDPASVAVLLQIAATPDNPFRVNAIKAIGELPSSPTTNAALAQLLDVTDATVRVAAYQVLADNKDGHVYTNNIHESFILDVVKSKGPPLIYCTRSAVPRMAIFGEKVALQMPVTYAAFENRLLISSPIERPKNVTIHYFDDIDQKSFNVISHADLPELIARMGGESKEGLHFEYSDMVAILQSMTSNKLVDAGFLLQDVPSAQEQLANGVLSVTPELARPVNGPGNADGDLRLSDPHVVNPGRPN